MPEKLQVTFGQELRRVAEASGFATQQELADAAGLSQTMVGKLYLDQRPNVSASILFKLCSAIGVDCNHFAPHLTDGESDGTEPKASKRTPTVKPGRTKNAADPTPGKGKKK
ncbi:helix-turn-helix domain-containing protein [Limnoglobus roseus]|uniref:HTH cro/C1-type domain-containing protein n=1 Tax=Limnoglobus roseus TaxID=2598579 RepID=A0A5C1ADV8_9BACT|nr:helix-turn-helix domain-containing protein [Limnoglobus roseus]QEL15892.1 hypothetical protein PX52LOC_02828 [Limnoglobus roseus]